MKKFCPGLVMTHEGVFVQKGIFPGYANMLITPNASLPTKCGFLTKIQFCSTRRCRAFVMMIFFLPSPSLLSFCSMGCKQQE